MWEWPLLTRFSRLAHRVGVDLGSTSIRIWSDREGFVVDEPSCVAVDERTNKVIAVGREAAAMAGRVTPHIRIHYPIQQGELFDLEIGRALLKICLQKVFHNPYFFRPLMMISVPSGSTQANRDAVTQLAYSVGAREVLTMAQPLAAAIGAGVPIADASGSFVVQVGSGRVEVAVISLGSVVASESGWQAGVVLDELIQDQVKSAAGLVISQREAQKVKHQLVSVAPGAPGSTAPSELLISGQDATHSSPRELKVAASVIRPVVESAVEKWEEQIKAVLSRIPPELTVDVIDKGLLLSGGGAQLRGLDQWLISRLGVPVCVVEEPDRTVIKGLATALENVDQLKASLGYQ